ncbi:MAG: putative CRISPR-associated protein [Candidatus Omnitrophica bacterium]|nr:putative CRISPR-associated protein [Candidatus Omnitrophota bacterium]
MSKEKKDIKGTHLMSVGTSILTNFQRLKGWDEKKGLPSKDELIKFVLEDPQRASAELNSLWEFLEKGEVGKVYLILTDTDECGLTGGVIREYLKRRGVVVEEKKIPGYYPKTGKRSWDEKEAENEFIEGLIKLRNALVDYIRNHREEDIYLNATGGFKPEVMVLTLVGSFYNLPVYYRHEHFKRVVYLPPVPLPYTDKELVRLLVGLNEKADKRLTKKELEGLKFKEEVVKEALGNGLVEEKRADGGERRELSLTGTGKFYAEVLKDLGEK